MPSVNQLSISYSQIENDSKDGRFELLCNAVQSCTLCHRMCDSKRVLSYASGRTDSKVMFIGEAPGRHGADDTEIPFHGDQAGNNFEKLLVFAGLSREDIFVTNAVLCNPKDDKGNNSTPTKEEIKNCSGFLKNQIELIHPEFVVTLGATALQALNHISPHQLELKESVRNIFSWNGLKLLPFYHPGQRAMLHRSFANQCSDYQFLAEQLNTKRKTNNSVSAVTNLYIIDIIKYIFSKINSVSYFKLHKLFYLIEYKYFEMYQIKATKSYIIRQKDGPYCTDLHFQKLKNSIDGLYVSKNSETGLTLELRSPLFSDISLDHSIKEVIDNVITEYGSLNHSELKTKVYLTKPMRALLLKEKDGFSSYNRAISFS